MAEEEEKDFWEDIWTLEPRELSKVEINTLKNMMRSTVFRKAAVMVMVHCRNIAMSNIGLKIISNPADSEKYLINNGTIIGINKAFHLLDDMAKSEDLEEEE